MAKIEHVYAIVFVGRKQMIGDRVLWSEYYAYDEDDLKVEVERYKDRADYKVIVFRRDDSESHDHVDRESPSTAVPENTRTYEGS